MARADSNEAEPSSGTRSKEARFHDRHPTGRLRRLTGQGRDPPGQDRQRRVRLDGVVAEGGEPALDSRHLTGLICRQDQRGRQLDAPVPFGRVQQVFQRQGRGAVRLVPVGGAQVQLRDHVGFDATELAEQEFPEQGVVAIPLAAAVERDQERVRRLQTRGAAVLARGSAEDRIAQRTRQLIEHGRTAQELLRRLGLPRQRLAVQVVGHIPIVARRSSPLSGALLGDQRGEVEPDRPAFGAFGDGRGQLGGEFDLRVGEDLPCARLRRGPGRRRRTRARRRTPAGAAGAAARRDSRRRVASPAAFPTSRRRARRDSRATAPRADRPA